HIVDANSVVLTALVVRDGGIPEVVRIPDGHAELYAALAVLSLGECDAALVSGGSSVGPEDHAPHVLAELGELAVHGVAMRPSSPAGFGFVRGAAPAPGAPAEAAVPERPVFLLPGNPVGCL